MVLQLRFPPDYVLDKMRMYELKSIMDYQYYAEKESWERARFIAYIVAQCNSTSKLNPSDILEFSWEKDNKQETEHITTMSNSELDRLKLKAQNYLNNINN